MPRSGPRWNRLRSDLAALERWLLPAECLLCARSPGAGDALICDVCRSRWRPVPHPQCGRCGQPTLRDRSCRICDRWPAPFVGGASAVWLDDSARLAVHLFKYEGWRRVGDCLAGSMTQLPPLVAGGTLVPIPLGPSRERGRGYNQSAVLARSLGSLAGLPVAADLLSRIRETPTQTSLTPEGRAANVHGAFRVLRSPGRRRLVLVDDVFTTGATLAAAAEALVAAGATEIGAVTFARAELPLAAASRSI